MVSLKYLLPLIIGINLTACNIALSSTYTVGSKGIRSDGLTLPDSTPLTGAGIKIGQVEEGRPTTGIDSSPNSNVVAAAVTLLDGQSISPDNNLVGGHATRVASVMISKDDTDNSSPANGDAPLGVAKDASLYSSAYVTPGGGPVAYDDAILTLQYISSTSNMRGVNYSWGKPTDPMGEAPDGNSQMTLALDWAAHKYHVLQVVAHDEGSGGNPLPMDNFNGLTVASSTKNVDGMYRQVSTGNYYGDLTPGDRVFVSLLAPGDAVEVASLGNAETITNGTSNAAPHVTGTVALLQQYGEDRIMKAGAPFWTPNARRPEVMKAVLINSADKILDDGTRTVNGIHVPQGGFLGMDRTVIDTNGLNWLQSDAFLDNTTDGLTPLDGHMGAGELDAKRALQQFSPGEIDSNGTATVPVIGWDFGHTPSINSNIKYQFSQPLQAGSFVSITIAFDRQVMFDSDSGTHDHYESGDTFAESNSSLLADDQINDLDLYLLPKGSTDFDNPIALSIGGDTTVDHIFAQIPTTGEYEFWVNQFDNDLGGGQDYAVAWWAMAAVTGTSQGDYNGDHVVDANDYTIWKSNFGTSNSAADGNGDDVVNAADYTVWRDHLGQSVGSGSSASVPEPTELALVGLAWIGSFAFVRNRRVSIAD